MAPCPIRNASALFGRARRHPTQAHSTYCALVLPSGTLAAACLSPPAGEVASSSTAPAGASALVAAPSDAASAAASEATSGGAAPGEGASLSAAGLAAVPAAGAGTSAEAAQRLLPARTAAVQDGFPTWPELQGLSRLCVQARALVGAPSFVVGQGGKLSHPLHPGSASALLWHINMRPLRRLNADAGRHARKHAAGSEARRVRCLRRERVGLDKIPDPG